VRLDVIGLQCPLPALKTKAALARMPVGALLAVEADDPLAAVDIPHAAASDGHMLLETSRNKGVLRFLIRRGTS